MLTLNEMKKVHNTLADLIDNPIIGIGIGTNEEYPTDLNQIVEHIDESVLRKPSIPFEHDTTTYRLSNFIDKLPHGILDKRITGIGATTLEIKSKRNSIIVVPTKTLAYNKSKQHDKTRYIGSPIEGVQTTKLEVVVNNYIRDNDIKHKKFLVVADSLQKLINHLVNNLSIDVYNDYFLVVDEIDLLQSDSNYRPSLEDVIDYYFKFNVKQRCLVSATIGIFSNPLLLEKECVFNLSNIHTPKRKIQLYHTQNINKTVEDEILKHPNDKILIAYNSVLEARNIISMLPQEQQHECAILCSEASKREANLYYNTLNIENQTLPQRINFMTSSYFVGVDIKDKYHLLTVSNKDKPFQLLTTSKITQIYGRCRFADGILSDTIVYNTYTHKNPPPEAVFIENELEPFNRDMYLVEKNTDLIKYKASLLLQAEKVVDLIKAADSISKGDQDLIDLFSIVKEGIKGKAIAKENHFKSQPIEIIRKNIDEEYVPAYLNIDFLVERYILNEYLYARPEELQNTLNELGYDTTLNIIPSDEQPVSENQKNRAKENLDEQKKLFDRDLRNIKEEIQERKQRDSPRDFIKYLTKEIRYSRRNRKTFFERYRELYEYVDTTVLLDELEDISNKNVKAYKTLKNAAMFWALAEDHPVRLAMRTAFALGQEYTADEIFNKIAPIVKYHFHKTIEKTIKSRPSVSLFRAFYATSRPRSTYIPTSENPLNFEAKMAIIPNRENNLLKYFVL